MSTTVDLGLLPLLRALLKYQSVTHAAQEIGVSPSAASQGLGRLREMLADPLLVRIGSQMQLTPKAQSLAQRIDVVAQELEDIFNGADFDPKSAKRLFVIAADDFMAYWFARPMLDLVMAEAHGIELQFIDVPSDFAVRMAAREIDFALMPQFIVQTFTVAPLRYRSLRRDPLGLLMDRNHPLATQTSIDKADLARFPHVRIHNDGYERYTPRHGGRPPDVAMAIQTMSKIDARVSHMCSLPGLLQDSDRIAILPYEIGVAMAKVWPLATRELSLGFGKIDEGIVWSPVFDADAAHAWFRARVEAQLAVHRNARPLQREAAAHSNLL